MVNEEDRAELKRACADLRDALDKRLKGGQPDEFSRSISEAIKQLTA